MAAKGEKPDGRGQLSAIERLPDWADEARTWALAALKERKLTQVEILDEFNARLRATAWEQGISDPPQISPAAFNRTSMQIAVSARRLAETTAVAKALAPRLDEVADDKVTLLLVETIKALAHEAMANAGRLEANGETAEMLALFSRAVKTAEEAKRISGDQRRKYEAEANKRFDQTITRVAAEAGLSSDRVAQLRRDFLGVRA